jgi:hypothetical protein
VKFDSFDLFVDTLTGKDMLYDTVEIVTQDIPPDCDNFLPLAESEDDECDIILQTGKRRRALISRDKIIEPYYKKVHAGFNSCKTVPHKISYFYQPLISYFSY